MTNTIKPFIMISFFLSSVKKSFLINNDFKSLSLIVPRYFQYFSLATLALYFFFFFLLVALQITNKHAWQFPIPAQRQGYVARRLARPLGMIFHDIRSVNGPFHLNEL